MPKSIIIIMLIFVVYIMFTNRLKTETPIIEDIKIDTNNQIYQKLSAKIRTIKRKGLPLLIKINSHPCAGKSTFIKHYNNYYNGCKLYDLDDFAFASKEERTSDMLLKKKSNSILFGSHRRHKDYDIHENVVYVFILPKLNHLYKNIVHRQLGLYPRWSSPKNIFQYRNNMYKLIIHKHQQIRPLFYSFKQGIDYCIQQYR